MWLQKSRCLVSCLCLTLLFVSTADAKNLYVNNVGGSDSQDGRAPNGSGGKSGPVRTISRAIQIAAKGDTIHVAKTTDPYQESISLQGGSNSGLVGKSFRIIGDGVVLDGRTEVPKDDWELLSDNTYSTPAPSPFTILYLGNKPAERVVLEDDVSDVPALEEEQWCLVNRRIYFRTNQTKLPREYDLTYNTRRVGITLVNCRHVVVQGFVIQGFQLDGINAHDNVFGATLLGITARGNGRSGISVGGASRVTIEACLVGNNGKAQVRTEGFSETKLKNNDLINEDPKAPAIVNQGGRIREIED
ncbi:right-handed parallel beta-helix repeat-containing protein [Pirellulaceae bacterium]|nr:right-handed parallel beta-helix repeat-containing protein [Pirellulaceae bacterium]